MGDMPTISRALEGEKKRHAPPHSYSQASLQGLLVAAIHRHLRLQVARHIGVLAAKLLRGECREITGLGSRGRRHFAL